LSAETSKSTSSNTTTKTMIKAAVTDLWHPSANEKAIGSRHVHPDRTEPSAETSCSTPARRKPRVRAVALLEARREHGRSIAGRSAAR
jgi:hypothetical protein